MTDFGMAKLLGSDPRLTPTYCPGTNGYMSPEALADPPAYTSKLDIFSCGVLFVQIITRKWPDPGPRTCTVQVNDPRFPSGQLLMLVPELERRKKHLDLISPTHPLLGVTLECLKDNEGQRPTAEQLCSRLIALKKSVAYQDSLQQTPEEMTGQTPPARDQEPEQQLRERVEDLTREVQQLTLQNEEQATSKGREIQQMQQQILAQTWQKDQEIRQLQQQIQTKMGEIQQLQQQFQSSCQENEDVVAALQQSVEQKDAVIRAKVDWLQEREKDIRQLLREREGCGVATRLLKLKWRDGPPALFATKGYSVVVHGDMIHCCDGNHGSSTVLMFNLRTLGWTVLPECPKKYFSIAVVNGQLTAIGGKESDKATNTLLSLPQDRPGIFQQKWIQQLPPMTYCHIFPAVATANTSLIVAGGHGPDREKAPVEVLDTQTLCWSTVASLPHPLQQATATICGDRLYIGSGCSTKGPSQSVLMCEIKDLLKSQSLATEQGLCSCPPVWKEVTPLPVIFSSLVMFQGQLLAVGGGTTHSSTDCTPDVRQYDTTTNSWKLIGQMKIKRAYSLAAVLPNNTLMVCGGNTPHSDSTNSVEIASLV